MSLPTVRRLAFVAAAAGGALAVGVGFLVGLAAKERDDRFCVSCHLHEAKYTRFLARAPVDLAGGHRMADAGLRCIDCHGGADLAMRLRVWTVAGFDTVRFLSGAYREPDHMRLPLRDAECRQCHTPIVRDAKQAAVPPATPAAAPPATATPATTDIVAPELIPETAMPPRAGPIAFHRIREHDVMPVACVTCHATHLVGGAPAQQFIVPKVMQPICRECHPAM